jgi:hypothetical protein
MRVVNDETYPTDIPSRRALFPHERLLLNSCLENLTFTREELAEQIRRCGPLSESTKQSAEINEEDHGKAILIFTVVTIIFLPLSFVTSFLGMNTVDIRDMDSTQALFWQIAIPLTAVVLGTITFIAYNGDELRDHLSNLYRILTGKQNHSTSARGISVAQRKRAAKLPSDSSSTLDYKSLADEAEYATPKPDNWNDTFYRSSAPERILPISSFEPAFRTQRTQTIADDWQVADDLAELRPSPVEPTLRSGLRVEPMSSRTAPPRRPLLGNGARRPGMPTPQGYQPEYKPNIPTYMRINRAHILPESIAHYGLPWEFDPKDTDFILIKKELSQAETDTLFEHTRLLKQKGFGDYEDVWYSGRSRPVGGKKTTFFTGGYDDEFLDVDGGLGKGEYTWVKKGKRGRRGPSRGYGGHY